MSLRCAIGLHRYNCLAPGEDGYPHSWGPSKGWPMGYGVMWVCCRCGREKWRKGCS